ncbi:MAG: hypothetical protein WED10_14275 [Brumimicrobium sp.]
MKKYSYLIVLLAVFLIQGCGSTSKTQEKEENKETQEVNSETSQTVGEVKINHQGCELVIVTEDDTPQMLHPVSLEETYKVDGTQLQFEYDYSRAPLPEGCEGTRVVVLRNVLQLKH